MKKKYSLWLVFLLLVTGSSFSQATKYKGTWQGTLEINGIELRIVFHINDTEKGGLLTTADSPDQSAYGMKCDTTIITGNAITIEMKSLGASYKGILQNDTTIEGTFAQRVELPLVLKKTDKQVTINRPQTPKAPFPYKSEDLVYSNADKSLNYGATITIPEGNGPFPAAVLITGSGAQDRDETIMNHKLFAVLADHLTRKGYIVLRVDDRGIGKSTGIFSEATSEDFAKDVNSSVDYLLSRKEVNKNKIGLIGHSEGGMIAPMVAAARKDINYIVLLAGPGVKIIELMAAQNEAIARSSGMSDQALKEIKPLFTKVVTTIMESKDSSSAHTAVTYITENWAASTKKEILEEMDFDAVNKRKEYINEMVEQFQSPWFKYFIRFNPATYLEKLRCKVLAINGDKDVQVLSAQNLPGIKAALKKSKVKNYEIKEMPGMNHLFQTCLKCTVNEYGELEETIAPAALETICSWLDKNVK